MPFASQLQFDTLDNGAVLTAREDGTSLLPYLGSGANRITVNGEINKLASNIGQARDFAGIHRRSDYAAGLLLGEAAALSVARDQHNVYTGEDFDGFVITKFDGTTVLV